jgi:hypothetical protein
MVQLLVLVNVQCMDCIVLPGKNSVTQRAPLAFCKRKVPGICQRFDLGLERVDSIFDVEKQIA